jgi:ABC-type sugar transport system ATPase subunit
VQDIERLGAFAIVTVKAGAETLKAIVRRAAEFDIDQAVKMTTERSAILVFNKVGQRVK